MNKKNILNLLYVIFATMPDKRACISPKIHEFLATYRDYLKSYEDNFPCCTKKCETAELTVNPLLTIFE